MCHSLVMNYGLYKKMEIFVGLQNQNDYFHDLSFVYYSGRNLPQNGK